MQHKLGSKNDINALHTKLVTLDFKLCNNYLEFYLNVTEEGNPLDIHCAQNMWLYITLSEKQWFWSTDNQAITTKYKRDNQYKRLRYIHDGKYLSWNDVKGKSQYNNIKTVAFEMRCREDYQDDIEGHGINLNVEFLVERLSGFRLPVTIDPDVINPKPIGLFDIFNISEKESGIPLFALNSDFEIIDHK